MVGLRDRNPTAVRAGQRWTRCDGPGADIQIVGRATEFDGWAVTWQGIGQSNVELWPTSRIVEGYVLASDRPGQADAVVGRRVSPDSATRLGDREWFVEKYVDEAVSTYAIGRSIGVSGTTVRAALVAHGIPRRGPSGRRPTVDAQLADTEWLRSRYAQVGLMRIAAELRTPERVGGTLDAAGIERLGSNASIVARPIRSSPHGMPKWRTAVERVVTDLGGDPDDYLWPDAGG